MAGDSFKDHTITIKASTSESLIRNEVKASFNLRVKNPCIDLDNIWIESAPLPVDVEYPVSREDFFIIHRRFISSVGEVCGPLGYKAWFEGFEISETSSPVAYEQFKFGIWSDDVSFLGEKQI